MKEFIKGVLSDNGLPSSSRLLMVLFGLFACGWVTYLVKINHALPDFSGLAIYIGTPYLINRGSNTLSDVLNKK